MKLEEGNDLQDTLVRQTIGKEPYLSFARTTDGPVQWIQLLTAFEHQDVLGWPLPTPLKVQMQKCDKCSQEFCSPVNYRRHIRVHRRSFNVDKDSYKNRELLGAFWDKVSSDEAKKILSFKDVILEGVPGSSIIKALASFVRAPGFCALPQVYVKAGSVLLDVIQDTPSRIPISSQEFFGVLDDASEKTFLCGGTTGSVQKFIFDGEAGKVGLEMKNLVACTSFLLEQNLIKAWIADKDAEALRCQKLLVEEEEAAQRRQAELLERRRQRKLRQKEQRTKEHSYKEKIELTVAANIEGNVPSAESFSPTPQFSAESFSPTPQFSAESSSPTPQSSAESSSPTPQSSIESSSPTPQSLDVLHALVDHNPSLNEPVDFKNEVIAQINALGGSSEQVDIGCANNVESQKRRENKDQYVVNRQSLVLESKSEVYALHCSQNLHIVKPGSMQKHVPCEDLRVSPVNSSKIWTRKGTIENGQESVTAVLSKEEKSQADHTSCEVMIGSIPVTVTSCTMQKQQIDSRSEALEEICNLDQVMPGKFGAQEKQLIPVASNISSSTLVQPENLPFSSNSAKTFLAKRWEEANSGDHETLILSTEPEGQGHCDVTNDPLETASHSILGRAESHLGNVGVVEHPANGHVNARGRRKPKKGIQMKYIAKQTENPKRVSN